MFGARGVAPIGLVLAVALLLVACSDGGGVSSTTTGSTSTTAIDATSSTTSSLARNTTATAVSTTDSITTTPSTTTRSTAAGVTTVPSDPTEPTTTTLPEGVPPRVTFPDDAARQAVVDAFYAYEDALGAASADPTADRLRADLLATVAEPFRSRVDEFIADLVANGEVIKSRDDIPTYTDVLASTVFVVDASATFDACAIDADIRFEVGANPDGTDRVVDDTIVSAALTYHLDLVDGTWLVSDLERTETWEGQQGCG